eukprot:CAMPEP_0176286344 /NCGR_PEP_ID=MMETSP0121_2-20121125/52855_1 /TAXON_ID=160619 /ORGANISM="Kryptoperidinium foliaceum, Strain CCMP 1326" /LENGTH=77 /DNA_ID=CAMNT_0017626893 /DNA_START=42 /DNA_END=273 /DNA_ORIENTATION=-
MAKAIGPADGSAEGDGPSAIAARGFAAASRATRENGVSAASLSDADSARIPAAPAQGIFRHLSTPSDGRAGPRGHAR